MGRMRGQQHRELGWEAGDWRGGCPCLVSREGRAPEWSSARPREGLEGLSRGRAHAAGWRPAGPGALGPAEG